MGGASHRDRLARALPRLGLVAAALVLLARTPGFFTAGTLGTVLALASIVGVLAVGQAFALIGGGFDLSQGALVALCAAVAADLAGPRDLGAAPAALAALALGAGLGAAVGACVAGVGTNAFVTTLSATLLYRGAAFVFLAGRPIRGITAFEGLSRGPTLAGTLVPWRGFAFLAAAAVAWFVLRGTVFGRHVYAVGGNVEAARLAGVRTFRVRVATFALSGLAAGAAAVMLLSWVRVAKPDTGVGLELDSIAACVVGGIALGGGAGSVLGAAAGCLLLQALGTWITIRGLQDEYRSLLTGAVILTFAAADALARRGRR
jgi:ribose transport system permease protein